jgi:hypothetical protein
VGELQRRDGKRAVGLWAYAATNWHDIEYRFARLGVLEPERMDHDRFLRLLLGSLHHGLSAEQRVQVDRALTPEPPAGTTGARPRHPKEHEALGLSGSAEYRRVMSDPRSTPLQKTEARYREMERLRRQAAAGGR